MRILRIFIKKVLYTMFFDLLIPIQPLIVYCFFKQLIYSLAWELFTFTAKINVMTLCAFKQKTTFYTTSMMVFTATPLTISFTIHTKHTFKITIAFYSIWNMLLVKLPHPF